MSVTQRDIAERAGVSVNTVSVVLRGVANTIVSDATRQRILKIADDLGYRPNPHARALVGAKAPLIRIAYRPWDDYISNVKGAALLNGLGDLGRDASIGSSIKSGDVHGTVASLLWGSPEAVVFQYPNMAADFIASVCRALHDEDVHVVMADFSAPLPDDVPCDAVRLDREGGAALAVRHLLELGHRRIGLVAARGHRGRAEGYDAVLDEHGIRERFVEQFDLAAQPGDSDRQQIVAQAASEATCALLDRHPSLTALVCSSDMVALGASHVLHARGLRVPDDIALIGFHGEPWTAFLPVPLSTMAEPVQAMCAHVHEFLTARFNGDRDPWRRVTVHYRLIARQSTGEALPGAADTGC